MRDAIYTYFPLYLKKTAAVNEEELYLTLQTIFGTFLITNFPDIQTEV